MKQHFFYSLLVVISSFSMSFAQTPGTLDSTFDSDGILIMAPGTLHDVVYDVEIQQDQQILFCGSGRVVATSGFTSDMIIGRRNTDGSLDNSFGTNGFVVKDFGVGSDFAYNLTVQPDGKIIVVGGASIVSVADPDWVVLRLNTDGTYDTTFNSTGIVQISLGSSEDYAYDVLVQPDGKILVAGNTKVPGFSYTRSALVRLNMDGSMDNTFGSSGIVIHTPLQVTTSETFRSVKLLPGGNIIAGGWAYQNSNYRLYLAGFNSDGSANPFFGTNGMYINNNGIEKAYDLAVVDDKLFACGSSSSANGLDAVMMQFDTLGVSNIFFGTNGFVLSSFNPLNANLHLAVQPDGKLLTSGTSGLGTINDRDFLCIRYLQNGTLDPTFGNNGYITISAGNAFDEANSIALQADGKIILGGFAALTNNDMVLMRLLNDSGAVSTSLPQQIVTADQWSVYPSPVSGNIITIESQMAAKSDVVINIYNLYGATVLKQSIKESDYSDNKITISLPFAMVSGLYYIQINSSKGLTSIPLIRID